MNLNEQKLLLCHILKVSPVKGINMWQALAKRLPSNIFNFCRKALILCLPNKSNLLSLEDYRRKSVINASFASICKLNFMCCQIGENA